MHGYMIIAQIRSTFGILISSSSVYPLLGILEENGYVKSEWKTNVRRPKKVYSLTMEGKRFLTFTEESLILICKNLLINGKTNTFSEIAVDSRSLQVKRLRSTR
jgi:DNA-binding PadR family transcriptional regulator